MIVLDYRTINPRWGLSGIEYSSWENYAFCLGYLSNENHYRNLNGSGLIDLHIEMNKEQGAWGKEGRIHYYGTESYLASQFADWNDAKSAGTRNITCRINSNDYMYALVNDFGFSVKTYPGYTTADIFPPSVDAFDGIWEVLERHLEYIGCESEEIDCIRESYEEGWDE